MRESSGLARVVLTSPNSSQDTPLREGVLMMSTRCAYPTDVSDGQWEVLQRLLPTPKWQPGGPGRKPMDLRLVLNGIFYVNKTGCQWRIGPPDFGKGHRMYRYFPHSRDTGVWGC